MKFYSKDYSLWLMPKGEIYHKFAEVIKKLAKEYHAPVFQPHITLLGEIEQPEDEVIRKAEQLASGQKPFPITLRQIDYQDYHFRALFVKAGVTEPLLNLHEKAKRLFGMENIPPYMPHLSLLYGNYPEDIKERIISEIGRDQTARFEINSVHLIRGGEVGEWEVIKKFTF